MGRIEYLHFTDEVNLPRVTQLMTWGFQGSNVGLGSDKAMRLAVGLEV